MTYRQCTRCVMDTSDPDISFDAEGHCNHCQAQLRRLAAWRARGVAATSDLSPLVEHVKRAGRSSKYDCVVGLSGGGDSCFATWVASKAGLRVLAVHMDNGWDTAVSVKNVKCVIDALQLDYESFVIDWDEFRDLQLSFLRASVPEIETPTDVAILGALHRVAAAHDVKYIILGGNYLNEGIRPKAWHYDPRDLKYMKAIHQKFGNGKMSQFPTFGYRDELYFKTARGMRMLYLLAQVSYTNAEVAKLLREELHWQPPGGKHHESTITRFVQSYVLPTKFGFDYRRATYSAQICAGDLTREVALARLESPPFEAAQLAADKFYVAKKFGITEDELDRIIALPPRSHTDYPNDQRFLEGMYGVYRRYLAPVASG